MKHAILAAFTALSMVGCSTTSNPMSKTHAAANPSSTPIIYFVGPMDLTIELASPDGFSTTAIMTDNGDRQFQLQRIDVPNGMRFANSDGVFIHFNKGEGIVQFVKDKPIDIKEFKKH